MSLILNCHSIGLPTLLVTDHRNGPRRSSPKYPTRHAHVYCQGRKQESGPTSGIHDPVVPSGGWGSGEKLAHRAQGAKEESFRESYEHLETEMNRREARLKKHGKMEDAPVSSRIKAAADAAREEEYRETHPHGVKKLLLDVKSALYSWLKSGVEPL